MSNRIPGKNNNIETKPLFLDDEEENFDSEDYATETESEEESSFNENDYSDFENDDYSDYENDFMNNENYIVDEDDSYTSFENEEEHDDMNKLDDEDAEEATAKEKEMKNKLILIGCFVLGGFLILLLILWLLSLLSNVGSGNKSYEQVEEIMKEAAISYFDEKPSSLPMNEEGSVVVDVQNLVAAKKMEPLSKYLKDGDKCTGKVYVTKTNGSYSYSPTLSCGNYGSKSLKDTLTGGSNVVTSGYGLYKDGNGYVFKGEEVNNVIEMDKAYWRVLRINSDGTMRAVLSLQSATMYSTVYDNRYNQTTGNNTGTNNFLTSRLKESIDELYSRNEDSKKDAILSTKDKTHLVNFDVCYGKRSGSELISDNANECSSKYSSKVGGITISDYLSASTDSNCKGIDYPSCQNYNYLASNATFWFINADKENDSRGYVYSGRKIKYADNTYNAIIRPVITLASTTQISGGAGTEADPYVVK